MGQKFYILFIILVSVSSFIYFRNKDKDFPNRDRMLFYLGLSLVAIGSCIVQAMHGYDILVDCLLLHERLVSGKLILIGYIFLLMSILFFTEKLINNIFRIFIERNRRR